MKAPTVVLAGNLSIEWQNAASKAAVGVLLTRWEGPPSGVLRYCQPLVPCVLVIDGEFLDDVDPDEFWAAVDFGTAMRVLVEIENSHIESAGRFMRMGCAGYLSKTSTHGEAAKALCAVLSGELWAGRRVLSALIRDLLRISNCRLSNREIEVLGLVSEGLKNSEIAARLFISPQTVRWHLRRLYSKLGTHDRRRAVMRAPVSQEHFAYAPACAGAAR